tara:strand:+ start:152 stop:283 length:132 start_codon:yes stop_codon:yes gene_type:complete
MTEEINSDEKYLDKIGKRIEFSLYTMFALSLMGLVGVLIFNFD